MSLDQNGKALNSLLKSVNGLPRVEKHGKAVFFGDSLTEGYGNTSDSMTDNGNGELYSYVDVLEELGLFESVANHGVSGSCIGPYSIYEDTNDRCMIKQIEAYASDIADADMVFLQYGNNDGFAIDAGNASIGLSTDSSDTETVCGYLRKGVLRIREINPAARIIYLAGTRWRPNKIVPMLTADERKSNDDLILKEVTMYRLLDDLYCTIIDISEGFDFAPFILPDYLHPDTTAHKHIAQVVMHNLFKNNDAVYPSRLFTVTSTPTETEGVNTFYIDGDYATARIMLYAGNCEVKMVMTDAENGNNLVMEPAMYGNTFITFLSHVPIAGLYHALLIWNLDGSISMSYV